MSGTTLVVLQGDQTGQELLDEAPHDTAPSLEGKNIANPIAMILAGAAVLCYVDDKQVHTPAAPFTRLPWKLYDNVCIPDLGAQSTASEFTDEVIRRVQAKLEVWDTLGD